MGRIAGVSSADVGGLGSSGGMLSINWPLQFW